MLLYTTSYQLKMIKIKRMLIWYFGILLNSYTHLLSFIFLELAGSGNMRNQQQYCFWFWLADLSQRVPKRLLFQCNGFIFFLFFSFKCSQRCSVVFCYLFSLLPMTGIDFKYWFSFVTDKYSLCLPFWHQPFHMIACWGSHIAILFCYCWYYFNTL